MLLEELGCEGLLESSGIVGLGAVTTERGWEPWISVPNFPLTVGVLGGEAGQRPVLFRGDGCTVCSTAGSRPAAQPHAPADILALLPARVEPQRLPPQASPWLRACCWSPGSYRSRCAGGVWAPIEPSLLRGLCIIELSFYFSANPLAGHRYNFLSLALQFWLDVLAACWSVSP